VKDLGEEHDSLSAKGELLGRSGNDGTSDEWLFSEANQLEERCATLMASIPTTCRSCRQTIETTAISVTRESSEHVNGDTVIGEDEYVAKCLHQERVEQVTEKETPCQ